MIQVDNKSYLIDSYDTGSMTKSAENCEVLAQESIKTAKDKFSCIETSVVSVVTDNAKNMEKICDALKEDDPSLVVYGCFAHPFSLPGQDIIPASVMKHVTVIPKYFRNHTKQMLGSVNVVTV